MMAKEKNNDKEFIQFSKLQRGEPKPPRKNQMDKFRVPETDLTVSDNFINVTTKLPGVNSNDLTLALTQNSLIIKCLNNKEAYYTEIKLEEQIIPQSALAWFQNNILNFNILKQKRSNVQLGSVDIETLRNELDQTKHNLQRSQEQFHAVQLEYQNLMVKGKKEVEQQIDTYKVSVIKKILKTVDNFTLALKSALNIKNKDMERVMVGIDLILNELLDIIKEEGVNEIPTTGMVLDTTQHEVMDCVETEEYPENTILEEYQKGYMYKNGIIRPSKVKVAVAPKKKKKK